MLATVSLAGPCTGQVPSDPEVADAEGDQQGWPAYGSYDLRAAYHVDGPPGEPPWGIEVAMGHYVKDPYESPPVGEPDIVLHFKAAGREFALAPSYVKASFPPYYTFPFDVANVTSANGTVFIQETWVESIWDDPNSGPTQIDRAPDSGFGRDYFWTPNNDSGTNASAPPPGGATPVPPNGDATDPPSSTSTPQHETPAPTAAALGMLLAVGIVLRRRRLTGSS